MGFWKNLFGKKNEVDNAYCSVCEVLHFVPNAKEDATHLIVLDGVSYAQEYCSLERGFE